MPNSEAHTCVSVPPQDLHVAASLDDIMLKTSVRQEVKSMTDAEAFVRDHNLANCEVLCILE